LPTEGPQPGVTIVSPAVHWISENGVNSSLFTIALTTEPLSRVWGSLSFLQASLLTTPTSLMRPL
jgi:hypothetical protein